MERINWKRAVATTFSVLALAACGSTGSPSEAETPYVTDTTAETFSTTTTLSLAACEIEIQQVQAGTKALTTYEYEQKCGSLPEGFVLETTTTIPPTTTTAYVPPATRATVAPQQNCPNGGYTNSAGNYVCSPYASSSAPPGATAQCRDSTYSFSQSRSGTCSSHGGVAQWL